MFDLQKASVLKRISAFILDAIILCIIATGTAVGISVLTHYDATSSEYEQRLSSCEDSFGVSFEITQEEYEAMSDEQRAAYDNAYASFIEDERSMALYSRMVTLTCVITSLSLFVGFLVCEFIVPLAFGNGMTLGKKVFSIAVMQQNGVKIRPVALFVRSILGKYTVETMIPVGLFLLSCFNLIGLGDCLAMIALMGVIQLVMCIVGKTNPQLHDAMAWTVAVDMDSQMIFDTEEELIKAKEEFYAERAAEDRSY